MLPPVAESIAEVRYIVAAARQAGRRVGFVPTMGALHAGHAALIRASRVEMEFTVVSIFVNPSQFNRPDDLDRYPRTMDADRALCAAVGADLIFAPSAEEMYPPGYSTWVDVARLGDHLCGPTRPGHFRGVATVVLKLLNAATPDVAFFGQKDAQQVRIIEQMVRDLDLPIRVRIVPTVREADGLAMSSRNRFLDAGQRREAPRIYAALQKVQQRVRAGERDVAALETALTAELASTRGAIVDYARVVDADTLQPVVKLERDGLAAAAVFFGTTRLIDNVALKLQP